MGRPGPSPAAYRLLLTLLPEDFRRRWGPDMEDVFALRLREAGSSPVRRLWVWARAVADVAAHAMAEWRSRLSGAPRPPRSWAQDLRYGVTSVLRARGFFAGAALTLALGIAAATATFAVVHAVLLQDLPYPEADRLVVLWPETNGNKSMVGLAEEGMVSVEVASGVSGWALTLNGVGEPAQIQATAVSNAHFDVMGVLPALGRGFQEGDDLPGAAGVVVLAHGFWVSAFGSDPSVIGRVVDMSGAEYDRRTVIGVMPPGYRPFIRGTDVWIPLEGDPSTPLEEDRTWYVNHRLARLRVGATLEQANREIGPHAERIRERLPGVFAEDDPRRATVQPLGAFVAGDTGPVIWVAMGAVSLVLLIACGNVTNLLLARGDAQERAHSIRVALGASRARVARMLMAQNAVIAGAGGLAGAFLARGFLEALIRLAPPDFPRLDEIGFGGPVLAYATVATAVTLAVAGVWPAVRASRAGGTAVLGGGARGSAGVGPGRLSRGLVAAQIALALMVAVGSGLMLRSLTRLASEEVGLDAGQTLTFNPTPPGGRYPTRADFQLYYDQVTERLAALPGVTSVGAIHLLPGTWGNWSF
ncbi:MAG: ABC transporter permease, partial [Gemmatimonadota bacterium]|nr:ABC transporter permease [Gemmatimonadota bacterium]